MVTCPIFYLSLLVFSYRIMCDFGGSVPVRCTEDSMGDNNTVLLFVLEYLGKVSISPEDEFESYEQLQVMAKKIRKRLIGNAGRGNVLLRCLDCVSNR